MDEINDFFKTHAPTQKLRGSQSGGFTMSSSYACSSSSEVAPKPKTKTGQEYASKFQEEEKNQAMECQYAFEDEDYTDDKEEASKTTVVLRKYNFNRSKTKLPIEDYKTKLLGLISTYTVIIVEGPTGCGKTTQIPQWILKECYEEQEHCNIIVTQPRRLATMCIANRVASEHNCEVGELVGYRIGMEKKVSSDTRLQYVTTQILLHELVTTKKLNKYTHIILDEVHERSQEMDFILILIRKLLKNNTSNVKIILMSATFNVKAFSDYFAFNSLDPLRHVPVLTVDYKDEEKPHIVQIFYLDDIYKLAPPNIETTKPDISNEMFELCVRLLNGIEIMDQYRYNDTASNEERPCVLIFLPGLYFIECLYNILNSKAKLKQIDEKCTMHKWCLIPLHSSITVIEQNRAFQKPPNGFRKILLATNIAESSITVPDVEYVIDFCLTKLNVVKAGSQFPMLQLCWASKANCTQRAGRVGRVKPGKVYRLVPKSTYENFDEEAVPELQRSNIESLILQAKMLKMGPPKNILALAMDPPDLSDIHKNILHLKTIGALYKTVDNVYSEEDGDMTYLGITMSKLPLDLRITKLIVLGHMFGCIEEAIIIGAALSTMNIFKSPFLKSLATYNCKLSWAQGSMSDCIAFLNIYKVYKSLDKSNNFSMRPGGMKLWADSSFLQQKAIREWDKLINEIKHRLQLEDLQINLQNSKIWTNVEVSLVLKVIIAGAFYPNYFLLGNQGEDEREVAKTLNGWNPCNSVYFNNMDNRQPGELYVSQLKEMFKNNGCTANNMQFDFDKNSSKIIVSFPSTSMEERNLVMGKVSLAVYQAVKMRLSKINMCLKVMPLTEALNHARELYIVTDAQTLRQEKLSFMANNLYIIPNLPGIDESYVILKIIKPNLDGQFWAQYADEETLTQLLRIRNRLNAPCADLHLLNTTPVIGGLYAAYDCDTLPMEFHRVVIESNLQNRAVVSFIDIGKNKIVDKEHIRALGPSLKDLKMIKPGVFKFVLSELTPSIIKDVRGLWSHEALTVIKELTIGKRLTGKVYSATYSLLSLQLYDGNVNINEYLVKRGFAQVAEESYWSKVNRDLRRRVDSMQLTEINAHNNGQNLKNMQSVSKHVVPNVTRCTQQIILKGPFSPLETTVCGLFNVGTNKIIHVDQNSVNSVLLDTDNSGFSRMLVGASISETESGQRYSVRNTTLMPNLPGIASILALIFCPTAELHTDEHNSCIVSTLCGLGFDEDDAALFHDYDIVVDTNVEITNEDLKMINSLRRIISETLINMEAKCFDDDIKLRTSNKIQSILNNLLSVPRKIHNLTPATNVWRWNSTDRSQVINTDDGVDYSLHIFPPIANTKLKPRNKFVIEKLLEANKKLHAISNMSSLLDNNDTYNCQLCGTNMLNIHTLSIHLYSKMHTDLEQSLFTNQL